MYKPICMTALASALLFGMAGTVLANDESDDIWHYLGHEGFVNSFPTLSIAVHEGVATIRGEVDSRLDKKKFERTVLGAPGVVEVKNLVRTSN